MRYIFLDTESANCFDNVYKLCEIGYVITDEKLNLLPGAADALINPGKGRDCRFYLKGRKNGRDLILAHPYEKYFASPTFDFFYDNLKFLLTQKDVKVFFWAGENDIQAIEDNCARYRLPLISFLSYDVQILLKRIAQLKQVSKLEKTLEDLGVDLSGITAHRPDEDARMTMMLLKVLCEKEGNDVETLLKKYPECQRDSIPAYEGMKKRHEEKMERRRIAEEEKERLKPYNDALNAIYAQEIEEDYPFEKRFSISLNMKRHLDETLSPVQEWLSRGYRTLRGLGVKYLVCYDEEEVNLLKEKLDTSNLIILTKEEFEKVVQ